jgi:SNF2 family DNA or RNA helicase
MRPQLPHQRRICDEIRVSPHKRWGIFGEPGTTKTKISLDIADLIRSNWDHIFIFIPANMKADWQKAIDLEGYFTKDQYTLVPYSQVSLKNTRDLAITDRSLLILDESHYIKNPKSKRSRWFIRLLKQVSPWVISLTGTPNPKNILDWWIQCYILQAWTGSFELNYQAFSNVYATWVDRMSGQGFQFRVMTGERNREQLMEGFKGRAFFLRLKDITDMPDKVYEPHYYQLTPEQKRYLKELKKDALSQIEITHDYATASIPNYLGVCSGFIRAQFDENANEYVRVKEDGKAVAERRTVFLDKNPKLELLETILESLGEKQVIIFCTQHPEIELVGKLISKMGIPFSVRHGKRSESDNMTARETFEKGVSQILLATVQSTSTGLDGMQHACNTIIYFSNTYNYLDRAQSENRIWRYGQQKTCVYIDLLAEGAPDHIVRENLDMKDIGVKSIFNKMVM